LKKKLKNLKAVIGKFDQTRKEACIKKGLISYDFEHAKYPVGRDESLAHFSGEKVGY